MSDILEIGIAISMGIFYNLMMKHVIDSDISLVKKILVGSGMWIMCLLFIFIVTSVIPVMFEMLPDIGSMINDTFTKLAVKG